MIAARGQYFYIIAEIRTKSFNGILITIYIPLLGYLNSN